MPAVQEDNPGTQITEITAGDRDIECVCDNRGKGRKLRPTGEHQIQTLTPVKLSDPKA